MFDFCWHSWSKWSAPKKAEQACSVGSFGEVRNFPITVQQKSCSKCGKVKTRKIMNAQVKAS